MANTSDDHTTSDPSVDPLFVISPYCQTNRSSETDEPLFQEVSQFVDDIRDWNKHDVAKQKALQTAITRVKDAAGLDDNRGTLPTFSVPEMYGIYSKYRVQSANNVRTKYEASSL